MFLKIITIKYITNMYKVYRYTAVIQFDTNRNKYSNIYIFIINNSIMLYNPPNVEYLTKYIGRVSF